MFKNFKDKFIYSSWSFTLIIISIYEKKNLNNKYLKNGVWKYLTAGASLKAYLAITTLDVFKLYLLSVVVFSELLKLKASSINITDLIHKNMISSDSPYKTSLY